MRKAHAPSSEALRSGEAFCRTSLFVFEPTENSFLKMANHGECDGVCDNCLFYKCSRSCGRGCDKCRNAAVEGCQRQTLLRFEDLPLSMRRGRVFCDECIITAGLCIDFGVLQNLG